MKITINVENADKEIKLLDEANSLIERLHSIFSELNYKIGRYETFAKTHSSDDE